MTESSEPMGEITADDKLWGLLNWIFSPLVPILVLLMEDKKNRPFIKYHAIQALIVVVIGWVVAGLLSFVVIGCFVYAALLIYQIYLGIQAYNGKWATVPFVTDFAKNQGWL